MGSKKRLKSGPKKMSKKSLFEEEQQKIKIIICCTEDFFQIVYRYIHSAIFANFAI